MLKVVALSLLGLASFGMLYLFYSAIRIACFDRGLIISPFNVVAGKDRDPQLGDHLAVMLQMHLRRMLAELDAAQRTLMTTSWVEQSDDTPANTSMLPFLTSKGVELPVQVFRVPELKMSVSGVEVGKLLPWIKNMLVSDRTIDLSVSYEAGRAVVTGDIGPLSGREGDFLEVASAGNDSTEIVDLVSSSFIRKKLIREGLPQLDALTDPEFLSLVKILVQINELNQQVKLRRVAPGQFAELLPAMKAIASKLRWNQVLYLTASLAERGGRSDEAIELYERTLVDIPQGVGDPQNAALVTRVNERLARLRPNAVADREKVFAAAKVRIEADVHYATEQLNLLFGKTYSPPTVVLESNDYQNAFWNGSDYHAPPQVQYLADI